MSAVKSLLLAVVLLLVTVGASEQATAAAGSNAIAQARTATGGVAACETSKQGQALIDCIADVMDRLATSVNRGEVPSKAPQIISLASQAATIRSKPKAEALRVLNRVISIARGLATKNAGDFQPAYNAIAGAFARAVTAIEKKG